MSSYLSAELSATCNALGYYDEKAQKYYADTNTLETVKDLIRYLRKDDGSFETRRQLGEIKVLQTDLLPLLKSHWQQSDLFDVILRLLVNLTTPALVLWNEEPPTEKVVRNYYLQIEDHLQNYKQAFTDESVWSVIAGRLSQILEIEYAERGDENGLIIERILTLIRNVLYVPVDQNLEKRPDNDPGVHDQVLWALHQSGMFDIILYVASSVNEHAYYMHILEILSYMMRDQTGSELARATLTRNETEKLRDEAELLSIRHRETHKKHDKLKKFTGARHSRFGGTYVVTTMKSISDNNMIYHKPLNKLNELNFDADKKKPKTPKNRLPVHEMVSERRSALGIRLFLKEFCVEFLNGAYNNLMHHVKGNLERAKGQSHDESYYLWALRFFMEFNRYYKFEVKLVSETMSLQAFHFVQQQMEHHFDMIHTDKKKTRLWAKRLHLALLAYRELLLSLCAMDKSADSGVRDSSKVIKSNIFYVLEYRELVLTLLVTFNELKMSELYLNDLMETQHIFIKMLENFVGKDSSVVVQKIKRQSKKKKSAPAPKDPEIKLEETWDRIAPQLSTVLEGGITIEVPPFDATSDVPIDEQKTEAMTKIQRSLGEEDFESAVALFRAAREVWPENDCFGSNDMSTHDEFLALRDVFFAKLGNDAVQIQPIYNSNFEPEDNEEEECSEPVTLEYDFKIEDFTKRLANTKIVHACGLALRNFEKNSPNTNYCIVKLLHRIAFGCKMYVMIFQVSIFRTFQKIFSLKELPQYSELVKFATYIMRQFIKVAETNNKVFMEALFWKSSKECFDIENGYGSYQQKGSAITKAWSEEQEDELRRLYMEHQQNNIEEDVVDWIIKNMIDNTKTRRAVIKKLKEMYLVVDKPKTNKSNKQWSAEEEAQLRELYEEFKDSADPLGAILEGLEVKRPKNRVIEKMQVLGLIHDRSELRKKRRKKSGRRSGSDNSGNSSDENTQRSSTKQSKKRTKTKQKSKEKNKQKPIRSSRADLVKHLKKVLELNMIEPLQWLKESICDALEDLGDDGEDVPLVPITEQSVEAMDNKDFQEMLKAMGICTPFDEQESYWRIPASLGTEHLKELSELTQRAVDNDLEEVVGERAKSRSRSISSARSRSISSARSRSISSARSRSISSARSKSRSRSISSARSRSKSSSRSRARSASSSTSRSRSNSRSSVGSARRSTVLNDDDLNKPSTSGTSTVAKKALHVTVGSDSEEDEVDRTKDKRQRSISSDLDPEPRKGIAQRSKRAIILSDKSDSESEDKGSRARRTPANDNDRSESSGDSQSGNERNKQRSRSSSIESKSTSSESEDGKNKNYGTSLNDRGSDKENNANNKRSRSRSRSASQSDSDVEKKTKKRRRVIVSDDED